MNLDDFPWLKNAYNTLMLPLENNRAHHALLIKHSINYGEEKLLPYLAKRLLCVTPKNNQPCEKCHSCQIFNAQHHPDYYVIELNKNKQSIGVDQIRAISSKIYEYSQQGGNKVIWIKIASLMTESAANALLKTLEEPPKGTYFLLSDLLNGQLLPTIRSRCQSYTLPILDIDFAINWLKSRIQQKNYTDNEIATALLLNNNSPFLATSLLEVNSWKKRLLFCQSLQDKLSQLDFWSLRHDFIQQEETIIRLNWLCTLLSDAFKAKQKAGKFIINRDQVALVRTIATFGTDNIARLFSIWNQTRDDLIATASLNSELIISNLMAQSELIVCSNRN